MFAGTCEASTKTEEICLSWSKPEGGNELDNYTVEWIEKDNLEYSHTIPYNGTESNSYTINNLHPGQAVNVSIRASNCAGVGRASWKIYATGKFPIDCIIVVGGLLTFYM